MTDVSEQTQQLSPSPERRPVTVRMAVVLGVVSMAYPAVLPSLGSYSVIFSPGSPLLSSVVTIIVVLALVQVITFFARRYVGTGGLLTYTYNPKRPFAGLLVAASLIGGYLAVIAATVATASQYVVSVLTKTGLDGVASPLAQAGIVALIGGFIGLGSYFGIEASFKLVMILGLAGLPFFLWVTIQGGLTVGLDFAPVLGTDTFNSGPILLGIALALGAFVGIDSVATLASDTDNPRRNIPRILYIVVLVGVPVVLISLVFSAPVVVQLGGQMTAGAASSISALAFASGLDWMSVPLDVLGLCATVAMGITMQNYAARFLAAGADVGLLPRFLGRLSPKRGNPTTAVVVLAIVAVGVPVLIGLGTAASPIGLAISIGVQVQYAWSISYIVVCVVAIWAIATKARRHRGTFLCAVAGLLGFAGLEVNTLKDGFASAGSTQAWVTVLIVFGIFAVFLVSHLVRRGQSIDLAAIDRVE
jgi:amino acid transporter